MAWIKNMKRLSALILAVTTVAVGVLSAPTLKERVYAEAAPQFTVKVGVELVNVLFSVTDRRGRFVGGLGPRDFAIEEDGRRQDILHFSSEHELPLTLGLLIDTSPSVRPVFEDEKETAVRFLEAILRPRDLALIIGFDRSVTLMQDFTENTRLLKKGILELEIGGGTSLYDAVYLAAEEKLDDEAGRKAIILISDGEDTTSKTKFFEALVAAHQSDAVIYSISNRGRRVFRGGGDPGTLKKFSEETGGKLFFVEDRKDFDEVFGQIALELRNQYSLAYVSTNTARDGKFRRIRIVPRESDHKVRARTGYYAAKDPVKQ
jgi:VWFA-related protein